MTGWSVTYPLPPAPGTRPARPDGSTRLVDPFPLGSCMSVASRDGTLRATLLTEPAPYLIVHAAPAEAEGLEEDLEAARRIAALRARLPLTPAVPKLAIVNRGDGGADLSYRTRLANGSGWHPRMALTGLIALGISLSRIATASSRILGTFTGSVIVATPAGARRLELAACPDGRPGIRAFVGNVVLFDQAPGRDA